jgi:hypothetical protein
VAISATGYGQTLLDSAAAVAAAQGTYFLVIGGRPVELHTPATDAFQAALAKYAHFTGVPGYGYYGGWEGADLMIAGLEKSGQNPTRTSFLDAVHQMNHYDAGGLNVAQNLTLDQFGKAQSPLCGWFVQLEGSKFVPVPSNGDMTCGTPLPNSDQLHS